MEVFARRALISKPFVRPVTKFSRERLEEQTGEVDKTIKIFKVVFSPSVYSISFREICWARETAEWKEKSRHKGFRGTFRKQKHRHEDRNHSSFTRTGSTSTLPSLHPSTPNLSKPRWVEKGKLKKKNRSNRNYPFYRLLGITMRQN